MARLKSKAMYDFIPGMASIMEDTNVEVNVEVTDSDSAEEVVEDVQTEEAVEEATEAEADSEETEEAVEMTLRRFGEIENAIKHVQRYGVDRSFVALMDHNYGLSRVINVNFPSVESMDATGDPYSTLSQRTIAGLENVLHSVWAWIKQLCQKIVGAFKKAGTWIMDLIRGFERKIQRLEKAISDKGPDADKKDDLTASDKVCVLDVNKIDKPAENIVKLSETTATNIIGQLQSVTKNLPTDIDSADVDKGFGASEKNLRDDETRGNKIKEEIAKIKDQWASILSKMRPETQITSIWKDNTALESQVNTHVQKARAWWDEIKDLRSNLDSAQRTVNSIENQVNRLEGDKRTERKVRGVKHLGNLLSQYQRVINLKIGINTDMVKFHIKQAATLISKCYSEKDDDATTSNTNKAAAGTTTA